MRFSINLLHAILINAILCNDDDDDDDDDHDHDDQDDDDYDGGVEC